ncbi:UDP-glycosyltransferase UGT5-like [Chironomus tepperi]|uniref:UDP-glycosyltransferase UGT5-like n=1 Tax=Chironomus tepperi TaxID=113505 RepID=UPI00391F03EF
MKIQPLIIIFVAFISASVGSRILFLFPTPSKSHMIIAHSLSRTLAEKGHDVTVVTPFPLNKSIKNHREIVIPYNKRAKEVMDKIMETKPKSFVEMVSLMMEVNFIEGEEMIASEKFQEITNEKFDLIVMGMNFQNFLLGYGEIFDCPVIILSVQRHFSGTNFLIGNPIAPNVAPHLTVAKYDMNFVDRVKNFIAYGLDLIFFAYANYRQKLIYKYKYFSSTNHRSYDDAVKNISLVLVNDHFTEGVVRPNVPGIIEVRGIQVKPTPDKLPDNIQKFLDEATNGAIFFSLGSNFKTEQVSDEKIKTILSVFSKIPQRVIMKWDYDIIEDKSDNVMLGKWLPQDDILAHPNVKVFISHCGLGSVVESRYHGVPILGLPLFADQMMNAKLAVEEGWAIEMDLKVLEEKEFHEKIKELVYNEKYATEAKQFSRLYRDRPLSPRDTAVYWTEYVINHRGAKHMQYPAIHQNFWQQNSLDVIGFLLLCLWIVVKIFKLILNAVKKKFVKNADSKKKQN